MEEIKNTEIEEVQEDKKEKKQVKSFKMTESQKKRVDDLLTKFEGGTESEKLLDILEFAIQHTRVPELPSNLKKSYEGDREKIATAIHTINMTFESLMLNTSQTMANEKAEINAAHQLEINELMNKQSELETRIKTLQEIASESEDECKVARVRELEMKKEFEEIREEMNFKDKVIEGLTTQLEEAKKEMLQLKTETKITIEESKAVVAKKDEEIAELATDSRKYKIKIETLETKNEELLSKVTTGQQENQSLTGKLSILEVNFENEKAKNADLKTQLDKVEVELLNERQSKSELQVEILKLMSTIRRQSNNENDNIRPVKDHQSKKSKTYQIKDQKNKVIWSGNKNELIKHINTLPNGQKITTSTDINIIEDLIHPCTLVIK